MRFAQLPAVTVLAVSLVLVTGCAPEPPAVSERVQKYYDENVLGAKASVPAAAPAPVAYFLGDSYTEGAGASAPALGYAQVAANALGWDATYVADPASGYMAKGQNGKQLGDLIEDAPPTPPAFVVIAEGFNDPARTFGLPEDIEEDLGVAKAKWPAATIVVLGPWTPLGEPERNQILVRDMIRDATAVHGLTFVDLVDGQWFIRGDVRTPDGVHPDDAGHGTIARFLVEAIKALPAT